jgi:predicted 2-oxoglutarate/Fe(II)-dependent dioxygenase YbiX
LSNITLTVLDGKVILEIEKSKNVTLTPGQHAAIPSETFHKVHTISKSPACYMYAYTNNSVSTNKRKDERSSLSNGVFQNFQHHIDNLIRSIALVSNALLRILYSVPMVRRVKIIEEI